MRVILTTIVFFISISVCSSQIKYNVVTHLIEDQIQYDGQTIHINGQKADIFITGNQTQQINLKVKLIGKNPDKQKAKKAIKAMEFTKTIQRRNIYFNNYIMLEKKPEKQTIHDVQYIIEVPRQAQLEISNKLGNIKITNMTGALNIEHKMGAITLLNCKSKVDLNQCIGNLEISEGEVKGNLKTSYVEVNLKKCSGDIAMSAQFGNITVNMPKALHKLVIKGNNTGVNLINTHCYIFNYSLTVDNGSIFLNDCIDKKGNIVKNTTQTQKSTKEYIIHKKPDNSLIEVKTKFADIHLF